MGALKISPPSQSIDCGNVDFAWRGGTPDYDLRILFPGGTLEFSQVEGLFATWLGNATEGIQLTLQITDSTGDSASVNFKPKAGSAFSPCTTNEFELLYPGTSSGQLSTATGSIVGSTPATLTSATITSASTLAPSISAASDSAGSALVSSSATAVVPPTETTASPPPPTTSNSLSNAEPKQGRVVLSTGAIVGIAIGATSIVVLVILVIYLLCKHKKHGNQRRTARSYSLDSSTLNNSESLRTLTWHSSLFQFRKEIQKRPMLNSVTSDFPPGYGHEPEAKVTLSADVETSNDAVRIAEAPWTPVSRAPTVPYLDDLGALQPPLPHPVTQT